MSSVETIYGTCLHRGHKSGSLLTSNVYFFLRKNIQISMKKKKSHCDCFSLPPQFFADLILAQNRQGLKCCTIFMHTSLAQIHVECISVKDLINDFHLHHLCSEQSMKGGKKQLSKYQCSCSIWRQPFKYLNYYMSIKVKTVRVIHVFQVNTMLVFDSLQIIHTINVPYCSLNASLRYFQLGSIDVIKNN